LGFLLAGLITGTNWYVQSKLASAKIDKQKEIQKRVNSNLTVNSNNHHYISRRLVQHCQLGQHRGRKGESHRGAATWQVYRKKKKRRAGGVHSAGTLHRKQNINSIRLS